MQFEAAAARLPAAAQPVRYMVRAATIRQDDIATAVHLLAASARSAVAYGARALRTGASVVLMVDAVELPARVAWSDGRRFRLEPETSDGERLLAGLGSVPQAHAQHRGSAVQPRQDNQPADHVEAAA